MHWTTDEHKEEKRYQLQLKLRYRVTQGARTIWRGTGYTTDLTRSEIRFAASRLLPENSRVELIIDWPVRFADMYPMELVVSGAVQRGDENEAVIRMISWQFRIATGARSFDMERAQGWAPRPRVRDDESVTAAAVM